MIKYFKTGPYINNQSIWFIELDVQKQVVLREIEFDQDMNIIRKAPSKEDNYGVHTDNLNVIIKGQEPKYKETIIINPNEKNTKEIDKKYFEKYWNTPYVYKKKGFLRKLFSK